MTFLLNHMAMDYSIYYLRKRSSDLSMKGYHCITCYTGWAYMHPVTYREDGIGHLK